MVRVIGIWVPLEDTLGSHFVARLFYQTAFKRS